MFIETLNSAMDYLVAGLCILLAIYYLITSTLGEVKKYRQLGNKNHVMGPVARGIFLGMVLLLIFGLIFFLMGYVPQYISIESEQVLIDPIQSSTIRWILLYISILPLIGFMTFKYSRWRGVITSTILLTIGVIGWQFDQWFGFIFISLPSYIFLLYLSYHLAQVVFPSTNGISDSQRWLKFKYLLFYLLGTQYPFWVSGSSVSRDLEKRIDGNFFVDFFPPGAAWSFSNQAVAVSAGIEFDNVEGPGLIFTGQYNRPVAAVDLRTQIRVAGVDATTRDGVPIKAIVITFFKVDNTVAPGAVILDRPDAIYPYSTSRLKSVLSTMGINTTPPLTGEQVKYYWDEWVVMQVQKAARQVISQRDLNQLWKPLNNSLGASALDEMAVEIKGLVEPLTYRYAIQLFASRIVNFKMDNKISARQIDSWKSIWSQKITAYQAEAEAADREETEKAHAYANSLFLGVVAESIRKANEGGNKQLSGKVIALYYIHAIEESIKRAPGYTSPEDKKRIQAIEDSIKSALKSASPADKERIRTVEESIKKALESINPDDKERLQAIKDFLLYRS